MPYLHYDMPKYPCEADMWDMLARESRPIVVYGMGNGADKLIARLEKYGVRIADFFASDGFVRGHLFHGMRVKSFSEIKETYPDFLVLLSFASNRAEVLAMLEEINGEYDMLVPDMPVAGEDEYFDREFYNAHYEELLRARDALADEESRCAFSAMLNYKLSGRMEYLLGAYSDREDIYSLIPADSIEFAVDAGAYNGDTLREMKEYFPRLKKALALEPDVRNFKKLLKYSEAETELSVKPINAAAWCENMDGEFFGSGNRNSSVSSTASFQHRDQAVRLVRIDSLCDGRVDYIKYDVEGAEAEALEGSRLTIERDLPAMLVSAYHRSRDIFALVNLLAERHPDYKIYLRRLRCVPAWELNLILIPEKREV